MRVAAGDEGEGTALGHSRDPACSIRPYGREHRRTQEEDLAPSISAFLAVLFDLGWLLDRSQRRAPACGTGRELAAAVADGALILAGGSTDGPFFRPTVVTDVSPASRLWTEEIFAPIAPILVVDTDDEAVAVTNDTEYGLVNSVLTGDPYRGIRLARRLRAGMVHVNDATPQDEALAPFGGRGQSGLGGR